MRFSSLHHYVDSYTWQIIFSSLWQYCHVCVFRQHSTVQKLMGIAPCPSGLWFHFFFLFIYFY